MIYYDVMSKKEKELWDVLEQLSDRNRLNRVEEISHRLGLTDFVVEQRLRQLNEKWQQLFDEDLPTLQQKRKYIADQQLVQMQQLILHESPGNAMLMDLFLDRFDMLRFMKGHKISQATVYRVRKEVVVALSSHGLAVHQSRLTGDEMIIRNLSMATLVFRMLDFDELTGMGTKAAVARISDRISSYFHLKLRHTETVLINNLNFMVRTRFAGGNFLNSEFPVSWEELDPDFLITLQEELAIPTDRMSNEIPQLLLFLYAFGFIGTLPLTRGDEAKKIRKLDEDFFAGVGHIFQLDQLPPDRYRKLRSIINQIHWRNHLYPNFFKAFGFMNNQNWEQQFMEMFHFTDELYMTHQILDPHYHFSPAERTKLYHDYFFVLVDFASENTVEFPVYLCVDFAQSSVMYNFINPLLSNIWFANIVVETTLEAHTDIYLSDRFDPSLQIPQLTWMQPPLYGELMELIQLAGTITREKEAKRK